MYYITNYGRQRKGQGRLDGPALGCKQRPARGGPAAPRVRGGRQRQGEHSQRAPPAAAAPLGLAGVPIGLGERVVPAD